ncbi:hypothetical protein NDI76_05760 [Halogeometricum sp. S1BR25-6]|uniref:Restriction endonuclease type IV Mrr domain-containing protein n=1 Tax=Halogeometricum salsisoli TaxID=2950536 RepID=A0ABU2GBP8_9EURY|nr:hypothetical protein [Halogeometricum sp. S1BR25-6]MDS0298241.1 hypothetical protein [Halogeometricum sp. S1BR25-6]
MDGGFDPYDVMRFERDFSGLVEGIEERDELEGLHEMVDWLETIRNRINHYFKTGQMEFDSVVRDFVILGRAIQETIDIPIVTPSGEPVDESFSDIFGERIIQEENIWETVYELQTASFLKNRGLEPELIHEGEDSGPDISLGFEGTSISIECKRRRPSDAIESNFGKQISDRINEGIDVGEDSFFVRLSGERPLTEEIVKPLAESAIQIVQKQGSRTTFEVEGAKYTVELVDYFTGEKEIALSIDELEQIMQFISPNSIKQLLVPFDYDRLSKGMEYTHMIKPSATKSTIKKAHVIDYDFPTISKDHFSKVMNIIEEGRSDLSGHSPSVLFVRLPADEVDSMGSYMIEDHRGNEVSQLERLEQRVHGQLKQSKSLNAIITESLYYETDIGTMSTYTGFSTHLNTNPGKAIPDEFFSMLETSI